MRVRVRMNQRSLRRLDQAVVTAIEQTAEAVKTEVIAANVMPFDSGTMQNESTSIDTSQSRRGKVSIASDTPYTRRLYFHPEYNFKQDKNPSARGRWYDPWIEGEKKTFAIKAFKRLYKRLTGV